MSSRGLDLVGELHDQEQALFSSVHEMPLWNTVSMVRQLVFRETIAASERLAADRGFPIDELPPLKARQHAVVQLAAIAGRSSGSAIAMVACGYVPEAKVGVRRLTECAVRSRALRDDESGDQAKAWMAGRPIGKISRLGQRYRRGSFLKSFSNTAHADADGFLLLAEEQVESSSVINIGPHRDEELTRMFFKMIACEVYTVTCILIDLFEGYQPPHSSLQEMVDVREDLGIKAPLEFPWPVPGLNAVLNGGS